MLELLNACKNKFGLRLFNHLFIPSIPGEAGSKLPSERSYKETEKMTMDG